MSRLSWCLDCRVYELPWYYCTPRDKPDSNKICNCWCDRHDHTAQEFKVTEVSVRFLNNQKERSHSAIKE